MKRSVLLIIAVVLALSCGNVLATEPSETQKKELQLAVENVTKAEIKGPTEVTILQQGKLVVPEGYAYVPGPEARQLLNALGNRVDDTCLGIIAPSNGEEWFGVISYVAAGYIKDDDAKNWNADDLMARIKEATEEGNAERRGRGLSEVEVLGWIAKPSYDEKTKRLLWAIQSRKKGEAGVPQGVNMKTLALGREGYIGLHIAAHAKTVEEIRPAAEKLLSGLTFNEGKRYADFNAATDKVAEYGLATLIAGAAAKKLGFFAVAAAFLAKGWKAIAAAVLGGGAIFTKLRKKKAESAATIEPNQDKKEG